VPVERRGRCLGLQLLGQRLDLGLVDSGQRLLADHLEDGAEVRAFAPGFHVAQSGFGEGPRS